MSSFSRARRAGASCARALAVAGTGAGAAFALSRRLPAAQADAPEAEASSSGPNGNPKPRPRNAAAGGLLAWLGLGTVVPDALEEIVEAEEDAEAARLAARREPAARQAEALYAERKRVEEIRERLEEEREELQLKEQAVEAEAARLVRLQREAAKDPRVDRLSPAGRMYAKLYDETTRPYPWLRRLQEPAPGDEGYEEFVAWRREQEDARRAGLERRSYMRFVDHRAGRDVFYRPRDGEVVDLAAEPYDPNDAESWRRREAFMGGFNVDGTPMDIMNPRHPPKPPVPEFLKNAESQEEFEAFLASEDLRERTIITEAKKRQRALAAELDAVERKLAEEGEEVGPLKSSRRPVLDESDPHGAGAGAGAGGPPPMPPRDPALRRAPTVAEVEGGANAGRPAHFGGPAAPGAVGAPSMKDQMAAQDSAAGIGVFENWAFTEAQRREHTVSQRKSELRRARAAKRRAGGFFGWLSTGLPNPGTMDDAVQAALEIESVHSFDGLRLEAAVPFLQTQLKQFQQTHQFSLYPPRPAKTEEEAQQTGPDHEKMAYMCNTVLVNGGGDNVMVATAFPMLGRYSGRWMQTWTPRINTTLEFNAEYGQPEASLVADAYYKLDDATIGFQWINQQVAKVEYTQALARQWTAGVGLVLYYGVGAAASMSSLQYKAADGKSVFSALMHPMMGNILSYTRRLDANWHVGTSFTHMPQRGDCTGKVFYKYVTEHAQYSCSVTDLDNIKGVLEAMLMPGIQLQVSGEMTHTTEEYKFGLGVQVGGH